MKVKRNWFDKLVAVFCGGCIVGIVVYLIIRWNQLPDKIPGHFNYKGEVDRWGTKGELLTLPIIGAVLYLGITLAQAFPKSWNTGVTITEENKERVYRNLMTMISSMKLIMVAMFAFMEYYQINIYNLPKYFLLVTLGVLFGVLAFFIVRLFRVK